MSLTLNFENSFATLPEYLYSKLPAQAVAKEPWLIHINPKGMELIDLSKESLLDPDFPSYFSGNKLLPGSCPLAQVYSGHQFGAWAGQLGDGRALLLGQVRNKKGKLWDVQLKGSGLTPYSRQGDGRAVLRSCIREYLCSEALHALNIPTTRSLCIVGTGEAVLREKPEPGAVFTRLMQSNIRFGHFEHFAANNHPQAVKILADHVIKEYFPKLNNSKNKYTDWFKEVVIRTATIIAKWQAVGFCHGVMNTDNMSALGFTIDYGPFGFMEAFDPGYICNKSDRSGRYAYNQQPRIGLWNLHAFAHSLQSLIPLEEAVSILEHYEITLADCYKAEMRQKIGLNREDDSRDTLWLTLTDLMIQQKSDYTLTFRYLADSFNEPDKWLNLFSEKAEASNWLNNYHKHIKDNASLESLTVQLNSINPKFVLRNWVAETVIRAAEDQHDYSLIGTVLNLLQAPYSEHKLWEKFAAPAPVEMKNLTVSCSS